MVVNALRNRLKVLISFGWLIAALAPASAYGSSLTVTQCEALLQPGWQAAVYIVDYSGEESGPGYGDVTVVSDKEPSKPKEEKEDRPEMGIPVPEPGLQIITPTPRKEIPLPMPVRETPPARPSRTPSKPYLN